MRADNVYFIETGADVTTPPAANRAWWNFQVSTAYDGSGGIASLESLVLTIDTLAGPNLPSATSFDLLALRQFVDARNGGGTAEYADIFQMSQNPEFGWFAVAVDGDANPSSFDFDAQGIWRFTLEARGAAGALRRVSMCVRTRGAAPLDNGRSPCEAQKSGKSKKSKKSKRSKRSRKSR